MSEGEEIFLSQCKACGMPIPEREHKFMKLRRFRLDFAWVDLMLGVEIEGGVWTGGRHTRGAGYSKDLEKYNLAAMHGWTVYRFTTQDVKKEIAIAFMTIIIRNGELIKGYEDIGRGFMLAHPDNTV